MFTDQIARIPRKCNEYTPTGKPEIANPTPLLPCPDDLTEGWGLSSSLSHTKSPTGRAAGSGSWEGVANLFWFADRQNRIGGIIASQILPYGGEWHCNNKTRGIQTHDFVSDLEVLGCSEAVEKIIYDDLVGK